MTPNIGVTDDQLGKFHRRVKAISERLGKSLPFDEVMQAFQKIHDGTLRIGCNESNDVHRLLKRPIGAQKQLNTLGIFNIPASSDKTLRELFGNKRRYTSVYIDTERDRTPCMLPNNQLGQKACHTVVYKLSGNSNDVSIAAELLGVPDITPVPWLQELLLSRGHTFTLPAIELLIDMQTEGGNVGLAEYNRKSGIRPGGQCEHMAFVEIAPGIVEVFSFSRSKPKQWHISGFYSLVDSHLEKTNYDNGEHRLIVRK